MNIPGQEQSKKKRVLIIDDEVNFTKLLKLNLEGTGKYEVRVENRGSAGLSAAKEFKPNMIFLDIMMEGIDGGEVSNQLGEDKDTENIPIVILTAIVNKNEEDDYKSFIAGHHFIAKPVTLNEILKCLNKYGL